MNNTVVGDFENRKTNEYQDFRFFWTSVIKPAIIWGILYFYGCRGMRFFVFLFCYDFAIITTTLLY